ncbi:hypothetical protein KUTeg_024095 [Tegillarca granosa]|uniref:G-protein coupled receptors family 1 profile domain-containing protein n=1 Tax=Tegillarca granosa TaxID=220873 RepID=A0ABQ9DWX9_TEGGR|nr:hypothetical protein KUTeg_024095 [Tegillarca granosa]
MSSVLSLGLIAIDRYIAIFYPFRYQEWITMPRMIAYTVGLWIISCVIGLLPLAGWSNWDGRCTLTEVIDYSYLAFWSVVCFTIGLVILVIYIRIFILTQKHFRQIKAAQITISSNMTSIPDSNFSLVGEPGDTGDVHDNEHNFTITCRHTYSYHWHTTKRLCIR